MRGTSLPGGGAHAPAGSIPCRPATRLPLRSAACHVRAQALAQCDQYLRSFGEHGTREAVFDTAGAARSITTHGWRCAPTTEPARSRLRGCRVWAARVRGSEARRLEVQDCRGKFQNVRDTVRLRSVEMLIKCTQSRIRVPLCELALNSQDEGSKRPFGGPLAPRGARKQFDQSSLINNQFVMGIHHVQQLVFCEANYPAIIW